MDDLGAWQATLARVEQARVSARLKYALSLTRPIRRHHPVVTALHAGARRLIALGTALIAIESAFGAVVEVARQAKAHEWLFTCCRASHHGYNNDEYYADGDSDAYVHFLFLESLSLFLGHFAVLQARKEFDALLVLIVFLSRRYTRT